MIKHKSWVTKLSVALFLFYAQESSAETFTGAKVLEWPEKSQNSLFQTSVTMIGFVATQTGSHGHIASCIDGWYWKGDQADPEKNESIRSAMRRFPEYHPQMVILAVVEKACGKFDESQ